MPRLTGSEATVLQRAQAIAPPRQQPLYVSRSMTRLLNYFLRGLVVVVPLALTIYVCALIFITIDSWLALPVRGAGFLLALVMITIVGALASSIVTRSLLTWVDQLFERLPFVRLLYSSAKDTLNAFVCRKEGIEQTVLAVDRHQTT